MTDRLNGVWVAFDREYRTDDAEPILAALKMVKGVLSVKPHVADFTDYSARERVKAELSEKLWDALHPELKELKRTK